MAKKSRHTIISVDSPGSAPDVLRRADATYSELREALIGAVGNVEYWRERAEKYEGLAQKFLDQASARIRREETVLWTERNAFAAILEESDERVPAEHVLQRTREFLARRMADMPVEVQISEAATAETTQ